MSNFHRAIVYFQILCRCLTFGINSYVIRIVDRNALGIMNIRLLLLESTLLFVSREAVRRATLSSTAQPNDKHIWPHIINQLWLTYVYKNTFGFIPKLLELLSTDSVDVHLFLFRSIQIHRLLICCIFSGPCLYIWLNVLSTVDVAYYDQYKFGCISIVVSCIIELLAEAHTFIAQVFCFVKLRVVLDTLNILVRSVLFLWIVMRDPGQAIFAFSIAQIGSTVAYVVGYYVYFIYYFDEANKQRAQIKRAEDDDIGDDKDDRQQKHSDDLIPLNSIKQLLPGVLHNPVSHTHTNRIFKFTNNRSLLDIDFTFSND